MSNKSVNSVTLLGYVGKDPEVRATSGGTVVANFSLATSERVKDGEQWADRTEWHSLVAFGRLSEVVRDYVTKGSKLYVQGKLQTRTWEDRTSHEKRSRTEIVVGALILLDKKESDPRTASKPFQAEDSDIPF